MIQKREAIRYTFKSPADMPRNTPIRMPIGLESKYESARYPNPPPTASAATNSTPIRMAIDRPFRNASGSSAIPRLRSKAAPSKQNCHGKSRHASCLAGPRRGGLRCREREDFLTVQRTSQDSFLTASPPVPLATVLPLPNYSTFELYQRLAGDVRCPVLLESGHSQRGL